MRRKIIQIDEEKCNGCGKCMPNCPEGALQLIDGKARLVSDLFCDGLGACIGECPLGAITVIEREAEPYDERKVMDNILRQGPATIRAHLKHLKDHGETKLLETAIAFLQEKGCQIPSLDNTGELHCGCPGSLAKRIQTPETGKLEKVPSALRQWPVQLKLLNPAAEYFEGADLLISADCVAHAYGGFHRDFLDGKILIVFCPKLDHASDEYVEKLAEIFRLHDIRSVTVARMEVPCCGGTTAIVKEALKAAGKTMEINVKIVGIDGLIKQ